MEEKQIKIEGIISLSDKYAREELTRLETKIATISERTKTIAVNYREILKRLKELEK